MEEDFYTGHLKEKFGLQVLILEADERNDVHRIIYNENLMSCKTSILMSCKTFNIIHITSNT
ncbi:MAG: hypothetical protein HXS46_16785 [Theionarchaea archaeon]|nr:MAG: hypothetical protein AYK18_13630 [Theionarchaea archaeon DG-70]MBU7012339.1 hypothetical protein [Theionarchaea archaeon]